MQFLAVRRIARHLRVLHACLDAAIPAGYAAKNPVDLLTQTQKPQKRRHEAPYFTDDELPKLLAEAREHDRPLFRLALVTGMRQGELLGLTWKRVTLSEDAIYVRESYRPGVGITEPKSERGKRTVALTTDAIDLLGALYGEQANPDDDALVFPGPNGYRHGSNVTRQLDKAMDRAGIPHSGEHLEPPTSADRTFHSFRHTYARIALENGAELTWLSRQLGHATAAFTEQVYGHWSTEARKREAAKLEGAFPA